MYQVVCILDGKEHILMDMRDEEYTIDTPKLTLQLNSAGSLEFKIHPTHPEISSIKPLVSLVKVYKLKGTDRKWIFTGRVMSDERDIYNTGKVKCEGILAYLLDSIVYPYEFEGTPADYVRQLIESHNSQVDTSKQFTVRTLDLADTDCNNNIVRANKNYPNTSREMRDKVIKLLSAYISAEEIDGKYYLDCFQTLNSYNTQQIRLGENIIDLKQTKGADTIRTVMIGIGEEDGDENRIRVIVENQEAIKNYGRIVGTVEFENVSTIEQLEKKTEAYLDSILAEINTVEVKAIDLNMTDADIEEIQLGYAYVESEYNDLDHIRMLISKMVIYLMQPDKNTFTLGADKKSITSSMSHANAALEDKIHQVAKTASKQIEYKVTNATQLITGAKGGYVILDCGEDAKSQPSQILIMDTPDKETATSVIRINKNGIGFSTTGYDGPYRNAWTIDGNLVADFITTGTMLADRIRGGTLEVGGAGLGKDGKITVIDANNKTVATIDKDGVNVYKGSISGATITAGSKDNADGVIYVKNADGNIVITLDCNGINVNDAFKVGIDGTITAVAISGGAVDQFSQMIDDSNAMKTAKQAIQTAQSAAETAQSAAETAQSTANTANAAAATANAAAETAQSAANTAQATANTANTTVTNLNETIIPQIKTWISQLSTQIKELGKPGIS